jgi:hypothetical protein
MLSDGQFHVISSSRPNQLIVDIPKRYAMMAYTNRNLDLHDKINCDGAKRVQLVGLVCLGRDDIPANKASFK